MLSARLCVQASLLCFAVVFVVGTLSRVPLLVAAGRAVAASLVGAFGGRFVGTTLEGIVEAAAAKSVATAGAGERREDESPR
jgi:hypothetical protein